MPMTNKPIVTSSGDSLELLETSAMTGGARILARIIFAAHGDLAPAHIHLLQDETYEVLSGRLAYALGESRRIAKPGETVTLPRGVAHQHYADGPEDAVVIMTMTPGLDFDYLLENFFGRGSEGKQLKGHAHNIQGLVWRRKLKSHFTLPGIPVWVQDTTAWIITPFAYLFGYRAVYQRFSGEEW
jgi:quercetin dioxygenase-like cupin family protein